MNSDIVNQLESIVGELREPENFYSGIKLPQDFAVPDNILVFYHTYTVPAPTSHGRYTIVIPFDEMTYYIEREPVELRPGNILLIPPYALRFIHPDSRGYRRMFITFELSNPQDYVKKGVCDISDAASTELMAFLDAFNNDNAQLSSLLLARLLDMLSPQEQTASSARKLDGHLEKMLEIVDSDLSKLGGIKELASDIGISESYLRVLFRNEFGISLGKYIVDKRMEAAKYKLLNTEDSISTIAKACGFSNVFVFNAFFKRHASCPPGQFRKSK